MEQTFTSVCTDLSHDGLGVVKYNNKTYFVNDLLPTEKATVKIIKEQKNYGFCKVVNRLTSSKHRVVKKCAYFGVCGGCDFCHVNYEFETDFKINKVNQTLKRIGHLDHLVKTIVKADETNHYRNKVQIPFKQYKNKTICGFYKKQTHEICEITDCYLQTPYTTSISIFVKNIMNEYKIKAYDELTNSGTLRHLLIRKNSNNEYMVVLIVNEYDNKFFNLLSNKIVNKFDKVKSIIVNYNKNKNNVILGDKFETLYGADYLYEYINNLKFKMSHKAFFQVNHAQATKLYNLALDMANIKPTDTVLDCYCGVGTISLLASLKAKKVIGIEIIKEAIDDAINNAKINDINNCEFICGDATKEINNINDIDILIVDPPRKGLDNNIIDVIVAKKINKIVYISCDVSTLARDLSILTNYYNIDDSTCVDLFPNTNHVETVVLLSKVQK